MKIHCPIYYQIYEREGIRWFLHEGTPFYNPRRISTDFNSTLQSNGLTKINVLVELFRINGGKHGYYLANIKDKKYHYCGQDWAGVKAKLRELGIGRDEPNYHS